MAMVPPTNNYAHIILFEGSHEPLVVAVQTRKRVPALVSEHQQIQSLGTNQTIPCSSPVKKLVSFAMLVIASGDTHRNGGFLDGSAERYVQRDNITNLCHHFVAPPSFDSCSGELRTHVHLDYDKAVDEFQRLAKLRDIFLPCSSVCWFDFDGDEVGWRVKVAKNGNDVCWRTLKLAQYWEGKFKL